MTAQEWAQMYDRLVAAFPNTKTTSYTGDVYFDELRGFSTRAVAAAVQGAVREGGEFFPSLSKLIERARTEQAVADEYDRLPDVTGIASLPEPERQGLLEAGQRESDRGERARREDEPRRLGEG